jgi:hypothetical protein
MVSMNTSAINLYRIRAEIQKPVLYHKFTGQNEKLNEQVFIDKQSNKMEVLLSHENVESADN